MKAVNLIPPELRSRVPGEGDPRIAYGVFGGLVLLLIMVVLSVTYSNKVTTINDQTAQLQAEAQRHQVKAKPVQSFNDFAGVAQSRTLLVGGLAASRFPWGKAMYNLSRSLPSDVTLTSMNALTADQDITAANQDTGAAAVQSTTVPTLELQGCTSSWIGYSRLQVWLKGMPGVKDVRSTQSTVGTASAVSGNDAAAKRTLNCGPATLTFTAKIYYQAREVNLVGLPKVSADSGASGTSGATGAAPAPAANTTPTQ